MSEYRESCARLKKAIETLDLYIQQKQKNIARFFSKLLLFRISKAYQLQLLTEEESSLKAIDVIKSHRLLIHKLQEGTEEQKMLAHAALNTITQYNELTRKWQQRLPGFLSKKIPGPIFPRHLPIELSLPVTTIHNAHEQVQKTALTSDSLSPYILTLEEKGAFWMKGITLLKSLGNPFLSIAKTQEEVRNAPISIHVDRLSKMISLTTVFEPLPGESYTLKGAFKSLPGGKRSLPLGNSFEISFKATQTAFPDPLQYLGCFGNALVPPCPHRLADMPTLAYYLDKKARLAKSLLPRGEYNATAKEQLEQKTRLLQQHQAELLPLHQQLMQHLTRTPFFSGLSDFAKLAEVYQQFALLFIETPFQKLQQQWLEKGVFSPQLLTDETTKVLQQLNGEVKNPYKDYLMLLGRTVGPSCHAIMLQHLSENLEFCPPKLSSFDLKIQLLLYKQLITFFYELESNRKITFEWLKTQMEEEVRLFTSYSHDPFTQEAQKICSELKEYFPSRYQVQTG